MTDDAIAQADALVAARTAKQPRGADLRPPPLPNPKLFDIARYAQAGNAEAARSLIVNMFLRPADLRAAGILTDAQLAAILALPAWPISRATAPPRKRR